MKKMLLWFTCKCGFNTDSLSEVQTHIFDNNKQHTFKVREVQRSV